MTSSDKPKLFLQKHNMGFFATMIYHTLGTFLIFGSLGRMIVHNLCKLISACLLYFRNTHTACYYLCLVK